MKSPNPNEKWVNTPFSLKDYRNIAVGAAKAGMPVCRYVSKLATDANAKRK